MQRGRAAVADNATAASTASESLSSVSVGSQASLNCASYETAGIRPASPACAMPCAIRRKSAATSSAEGGVQPVPHAEGISGGLLPPGSVRPRPPSSMRSTCVCPCVRGKRCGGRKIQRIPYHIRYFCLFWLSSASLGSYLGTLLPSLAQYGCYHRASCPVQLLSQGNVTGFCKSFHNAQGGKSVAMLPGCALGLYMEV